MSLGAIRLTHRFRGPLAGCLSVDLGGHDATTPDHLARFGAAHDRIKARPAR